MTKPMMDDGARHILYQSLPVLATHKHQLIDAMQESLAAVEGPDEPFGQAEVTAMMLIEMLVAQTSELLERGTLSDPARMIADHRANDIVGRHYSRFGDALVPVMRDVLGARLPRELPAIWCDTFWTIIRTAHAEAAGVAVPA